MILRKVAISAALVLAWILAGCGTTEPAAECATAQECKGQLGTGCQWLCKDHKCLESCPSQCDVPVDCTGQSWPLACNGHWECAQNQCKAVCDSTSCGTATDCKDPFPLDCQGHWECVAKTCTPVCDGKKCQQAAECLSEVWTEPCEGHWECLESRCTQVCDEFPCKGADDCSDLPWPIRCTGHWECPAGICNPVCDSNPCQIDSDCDVFALPCNPGHWICADGQCAPVCESTCASVRDCLDDPWLEPCLGHWECASDGCKPVCETTSCGDGNCDAAGGESPDSCSFDCGGECKTPADCETIPWPINCIGHWECNNNWCDAVCDEPPVCREPIDCANQPWLVDCLGHWDCVAGICKEACDFENCGDGFCDQKLGETPASCPGDCDVACRVPEDCSNLPWPLDCRGHWECPEGSCVAICDELQCQVPFDCIDLPWNVDCLGRWSCNDGTCVPTCDFQNCGDTFCDTKNGESPQSCPNDCLPTECTTNLDCVPFDWNVKCQGHWECTVGVCIPRCENLTCGDHFCDPEGGESQGSCMVDCQVWCQLPSDCLGFPWTQDCYGHWGCDLGQCLPVCDARTCPDGFCDSKNGESPQSCPMDCTIKCQVPSDCLREPWNVFCQGHWTCAFGFCEAVCENVACGDGKCDPVGGETPSSCNVDCGLRCEVPSDCLGLPWMVDCLGHWGCDLGQCLPICDFETCGDKFCDEKGGESPESCPLDCGNIVCVPEGMPTGVPPACCPELIGVSDCLPDEPCPGSLLFCVDCSDGICDPHENPYNCLFDCPKGCAPGELRDFVCPNGLRAPWCVCEASKCQPLCLAVGTRSEGWYDPCANNQLIRYAACEKHVAECRAIGSYSEGWYDASSVGGELIVDDYCAPLWQCVIDPMVNCGIGPGVNPR